MNGYTPEYAIEQNPIKLVPNRLQIAQFGTNFPNLQCGLPNAY